MGRPMGTVGAVAVTSYQVANVVVSVGPYTCTRRAGAPRSATVATAAGSTASPPNSTTRPAKTVGSWAANWLNRAVVTNRVPTRWAARRSGDSSVSRGTTASVAPAASAPHTSKVAASNDGLDAKATTSPGASDT